MPSHGEPMDDPAAALEATREALEPLITMRRGGVPLAVDHWLDDPWEELSPHLLRNRTSIATSFAVLSDSGGALIVDWGYDLWLGTAIGVDRAGLRPLLQSIGALRRNHGVERVEAVVVTHYHDDHVAGINLLREVEGTEVWAPANVAPVLERPELYDLPCLWFDPVPVDRVLELGQPFPWHEYELTAHALPGHTLYAAAIELEVDGTRVLATGDQQGGGAGDEPDILNYQYRNRFRIDDYVAGAELYARLRPELLLTGHWAPRPVDDAYLARLLEDGKRLAELHRDVLPLDDVDFGAEGFGARIVPYRSTCAAGETLVLDVEVLNPFGREETAAVELVVPQGWEVAPARAEVLLAAHGTGSVRFDVRPAAPGAAVIAADLSVGDRRFGQQAQALVNAT
jgi:glyoxylase-like metal-dependent hydrolase (beta-lactamase superfamily II)